MPRYFFDIYDGVAAQDDDGTECKDIADVRRQILQLLPDIARDELPKTGDQRTFTVLVKDESGNSVYTATLTYNGLSLLR